MFLNTSHLFSLSELYTKNDCQNCVNQQYAHKSAGYTSPDHIFFSRLHVIILSILELENLLPIGSYPNYTHRAKLALCSTSTHLHQLSCLSVKFKVSASVSVHLRHKMLDGNLSCSILQKYDLVTGFFPQNNFIPRYLSARGQS